MSNTRVKPYLSFGGRSEEALEFYRHAVGAEIEMMLHHMDNPDPPPRGMLPPGFEDKVIHATFRIGSSTLQASDGYGEQTEFNGFSLSIAVESKAEAERVFAALSSGGEVQMELTKTFWSPHFGMLKDRFGVAWMVTVASQQPD